MLDAPGRITLGSRPSAVASLASKSAFQKVLRILGVLFVFLSLAVVFVPSVTPGVLIGMSIPDCGMLLEDLFAPPGSGCMRFAGDRATFALIYAGIGVLFLTFGGIRSRLMLWGCAVTLASPYLMTQSAETVMNGDDVAGFCGTYLGDFSRRGIESMSSDGASWPLFSVCGEVALDRLYLTLGVAASGLLLVAISRFVSRKQRRSA